jgi:hypothetical protein
LKKIFLPPHQIYFSSNFILSSFDFTLQTGILKKRDLECKIHNQTDITAEKARESVPEG